MRNIIDVICSDILWNFITHVLKYRSQKKYQSISCHLVYYNLNVKNYVTQKIENKNLYLYFTILEIKILSINLINFLSMKNII